MRAKLKINLCVNTESRGDHSVPTGWPQDPYRRPYGGTPGAPIMYQPTADPDDAAAGYAYSNPESQEESDLYFYHPDHLGSTSYVTDAEGHATQFLSYQPYGAPLLDEHTVSFDSPYKFNAKELDSETGLYYYGARYYDPQLSLFYGTDRYAQKFPWQSPYSYAGGNPVGNVDINGDSLKVLTADGKFLFTLDDKSQANTSCTAKQLYDKGVQWFEPDADDYMELIELSPNIRDFSNLKHFSWDDVISFGEIDRWMIAYRAGGDGDWKAKGKPGDGYLMVTVDGFPYWTDAIGQVPFALNKYVDELKSSGSHALAKSCTIQTAIDYGDGKFFGSADYSNSYDNAMVRRAVEWAGHRYIVSPKGNFDWSYPVKKNDYSPSKMKFK